jgi:hypothetical protein
MAKLHQIVALVKTKKGQAESGFTKLYFMLQKVDLLGGLARKYEPIDDADIDRPPSESKRIQLRVSEAIDQAKEALGSLIDLVSTQDNANTLAFADVVVDGNVLLSHVPATHLLFLEHKLEDLHTFVGKLPTLDPSEAWHEDDQEGCYATEPSKTVRTKKIPHNNVKYEATDKHPAQVETWMEDKPVGYWSTTKFSGAIPDADKRAMIVRIRKLQDAVKTARCEANCIEVKDVKVADKLFGYIFDNNG